MTLRRARMVLGGWLLGLLAFVLGGCAGAPAPTAGKPISDVLEGARVLWVGAHPDDEAMAGAFLARACVRSRGACHLVVLTRGGGGECLLEEGCAGGLGAIRHAELAAAARVYRATLEHYDFFNAPLPVSSFPSRAEIEHRWMTEGDPVGLVARAIRRFRPDTIVTFDPTQGFTGHPEHQAAARVALAAARLAADAGAGNALVASERAHRVGRVYQLLNRYWFMALGGMDPKPFHHTLQGDDPCGEDQSGQRRTCTQVMAAATRVHGSQFDDMDAIRSATRWWGTTYVREVDPYASEVDALLLELRRSE